MDQASKSNRDSTTTETLSVTETFKGTLSAGQQFDAEWKLRLVMGPNEKTELDCHLTECVVFGHENSSGTRPRIVVDEVVAADATNLQLLRELWLLSKSNGDREEKR